MPKATHDQGVDIRGQLGGREASSGLMCPACLGGERRERSVSAWRRGLELTAKCWRNKCTWFGSWDLIDVGGVINAKPVGRGHAGPRHALDTLPLTDATQAALEAHYGLLGETIRRYGLRQTSAAQACYCPIQGPVGHFRGWIRRWLVTGATLGSKVKSYPADTFGHDEPWQGWFRASAERGACGLGLVVCVEDVFSAMRLAQAGVNAVSLLGTSMSAAKVLEIRQHSGTIVVALDADAYGRATGYAERFMVHVRRLEQDIKDMPEETLTQWISCLYSSLRVSTPEKPVM